MNTSMHKVRKLNIAAVFAALMVLGAYIRIPGPLLSMTLQTFFVLSSGFLLGSKTAFFSMLLYLCMGLIGLPVFTEGGGIAYVLKPSFGFIIGFCIGAFVTGYLSRKNPQSLLRLFLAGCAGLASIYVTGLSYYALISGTVLGIPVSARSLFLYCFLLPLPGDSISCFLAAALAKRMLPISRKMGFFS